MQLQISSDSVTPESPDSRAQSQEVADSIDFYRRQKALHIRKNGRVGAIGFVRARARYQGLVPRMSLMHGRTQHMIVSAAVMEKKVPGKHWLPCR